MEIREQITNAVHDACAELELGEASFTLEHPDDLAHGDYATNVALVAAKQAGENPRELAEKMVGVLEQNKPDEIETIEIAGPGFINFRLAPQFFTDVTTEISEQRDSFGASRAQGGEKVMVEYTDPNVLKEFHIGHLMSNAIGEAIARITEASGARVVRANYQGDVGLHVAKAVWGIRDLASERPSDDAPLAEKAAFIGRAYAHGASVYEENEDAQREIQEINKQIYEQSDAEINELYQWGRQVSLDHFEEIYKMLGTRFDHYFFESDVAYDGRQLVEKGLEEGVLKESDGAIVFPGENYGLHTRVFITSQDIPTYEAKELGLNTRKFQIVPDLTHSIIVTANEQDAYFKVVLKALEELKPEIAEKTQHISHGMMRFTQGKMSSRKGNVITGTSLIDDIKGMVRRKMAERDLPEEEKEKIVEQVAVGAIKYSILKQSTGRDIAFDAEHAISFEGDSGPYLQYTYTRAGAVLEKANAEGVELSAERSDYQVTTLERILYRYPEVVERAARERAPHHVAGFLTELASTFNAFYGEEKIVDANDPTSPYKVALTQAVKHVLQAGLERLGIEAPERM